MCPGCGGPLTKTAGIICGGLGAHGRRGCQRVVSRVCTNPECRAMEASPGIFVGRGGQVITPQQALDL